MKIVNLFVVFGLLLSSSAFALTCDQWKEKLPPRFAKEIQVSSDPKTGLQELTLNCGKSIGKAVISYAKYKGINALILQLTASVGISGATTSMVMVGGHQVLVAYKAAQFVAKAFAKDKDCFYNHEYKRSLYEPISHFYTPELIEGWVNDLGCTHISQMISSKIKSVENEIREVRRKQVDFEKYTFGRNLPEGRAERMFPLVQRTLTEKQKIFLEKNEKIEKPIPLFDAATDLIPCLKPSSVTKIACDLVSELSVDYLSKNFNKRNAGLDPDLKETLIRVSREKR